MTSCSYFSLISLIFLLFYIFEGTSFSSSNQYYEINLPAGVVGPESLAFDCNDGGPYVSVSDGRILKWDEQNQNWIEFAITAPNRDIQLCDGKRDTSRESLCGRPLGLKFHPKTCDLYIGDAYFGLMKVGSNGGVAIQLANSAQGVPFKFINDLDIDLNTGVVYFTDSSIHYQRRDYSEIISNGDSTGRLLRYDMNTKEVSVLYSGLAFPNGLVLSQNNTYLLVVESTRNHILRFPISGYEVGTPYVFASVDRFPDNIRRNDHQEYWVALNTAREGYVEAPVGVKFDEHGTRIQVVNSNDNNNLQFVSEIEEHGGRLWFGSPRQPFVGTMPSS